MFEKRKAKALLSPLFDIADDLYQDITDVERIPMASTFDTEDAVIALAWILCESFGSNKKLGVEIAKQGVLQTNRVNKVMRGGVEQVLTGVQSAYEKYKTALTNIVVNTDNSLENSLKAYGKIRKELATVMAEIIGDVYGYEGDSVEICGEAYDRVFNLIT